MQAFRERGGQWVRRARGAGGLRGPGGCSPLPADGRKGVFVRGVWVHITIVLKLVGEE